MTKKLGCFYLDDVGAKGNRKFRSVVKKINNWDYKDSNLYWSANRISWECHKAKKRNRVYKRENRKLIDLWWTVYYLKGIKLNGFDLGTLYIKKYGSDEE